MATLGKYLQRVHQNLTYEHEPHAEQVDLEVEVEVEVGLEVEVEVE